MIPLRDVIPSRTTPYITVAIIILNAMAWLVEVAMPPDLLPSFLQLYGVVPAHFFPPTLITSMFLHGGWLHLIGNMWYLWIFGDNVEDRLGHFTYLIFYLLCGLGAGIAQTVLNYDSVIPSLGASGAIDELGAYFNFTFSNRADLPHFVLDLDPKSKGIAKRVRHIKIWIDKKSYLTTKFEYTEGDGDITRYEFSNIKTNAPVAPSRFSLNLPPNTRIDAMKLQ